MVTLGQLLKSYEAWVAQNADAVGDLESSAKWATYLIAGRITDSSIATELIYSLSNLLVLYNDRIIAKHRPQLAAATAYQGSTSMRSDSKSFVDRLKVMLTTLEYCEVVIEVSAKRMFGTKGKWVFVVLVQFLKAAGRFFILKHSTDRIITSPALPALNRHRMLKKANEPLGGNRVLEEHDFTFKLKRSGRLEEVATLQRQQHPQALLQAEYLYIAKPLIHLASMGVFGEKSWKQFVVSLAVDLASIKMYHKNRRLMTKEQQRVLSHRCLNLCMYLMRSPFYDSVTKSRLEKALELLGQVPIAKMVALPLREYLPRFQNMYFYIWST